MPDVDWSKRSYTKEEFYTEYSKSSDWIDLAQRLGLSTTSSGTKSYLDRAANSLGLDPSKLGRFKNKYSVSELETAVKGSTSFSGVLRKLGLKVSGGNHSHIKRKILKMELDISHFTGKSSNAGRTSANRKSAKDVLVLGSSSDNRINASRLRRYLVEEGINEKCNSCGLGKVWNDSPIVLEVSHVNGDFWDNRLENLEFLCPNCHSQETETNRPHKYSDIRQDV